MKFDDANGTRIELEPAIQSKAITLYSVEAVKAEAFRARFDDSYLRVLDDGEAESLAYLFDSKNKQFYFAGFMIPTEHAVLKGMTQSRSPSGFIIQRLQVILVSLEDTE